MPLTSEQPVATYRLPWDSDVRPKVLMSARGRLFEGNDFFDNGSYLTFYQNPAILFPDGRVHVEDGETYAFSLVHQFMGVPPSSVPLDLLVNFFSSNASILNFKLCLAVLCGRKFFHEEATVTEVLSFGEGYVYRTDRFDMEVPYIHTPLNKGQTYPKGWIVGGGVEVYPTEEDRDTEWWGYEEPNGVSQTNRFGDRLYLFDWLPLDRPVCLQNKLVPAYSIYSDFSEDQASTHIRFQLSEDREEDDAYWAYVWKKERLSGRYLNSLVGLEAPPPPNTAFTGAPSCWAEVEYNFLQVLYFKRLFNEPEGYPDLDALPGNLVGWVNPLKLLMEAGLKDFAVFVRIRNDLYQAAAPWLGPFLRKAHFLDRLLLVEIDGYEVRDDNAPETVSSVSTISVVPATDKHTVDIPSAVSTYSTFNVTT